MGFWQDLIKDINDKAANIERDGRIEQELQEDLQEIINEVTAE